MLVILPAVNDKLVGEAEITKSTITVSYIRMQRST